MSVSDPRVDARTCLHVLGARSTAFAIGLSATAPVTEVAAGRGEFDRGTAGRVAALARGIARLRPIWGDDGAATCLRGMCPAIQDRAAIAVLRDGDLTAFELAVDAYVKSFYLGQGG